MVAVAYCLPGRAKDLSAGIRLISVKCSENFFGFFFFKVLGICIETDGRTGRLQCSLRRYSEEPVQEISGVNQQYKCEEESTPHETLMRGKLHVPVERTDICAMFTPSLVF